MAPRKKATYHLAWDFTLPNSTRLHGTNSDWSDPTNKDHIQKVADTLNGAHGAETHKVVRNTKNKKADFHDIA